ncbi:hypothetical protein CROQUDRAFT_663988 [Cronartium quercuum f. sp. fusiforme G11]|uniref:Oxidoreductase-like domain-containing protein n=1 Tax=Cronartium quercuum f. sp. fusiforme G11 TaxID=708437 RepID=A0A9P6T6T0_9BASI|nr:hypothetical protein CROQUDRAFT_663988 [Cronartium quercuum f. sp. fusiforme G11]
MSIRYSPKPDSRILLRHLSSFVSPVSPRRVYIIVNGSDRLNCTPVPNDELRTELRPQLRQVLKDERPTVNPGQSPPNLSLSWICVDGAQLDLRHQFTSGAPTKHLQGFVGLTIKESAHSHDRSKPFISSLPSQSQVHSLLSLSASQGKKEEVDVSVPSKPTPPGPEDCCMSGCAHCVHDIYFEELTAYQAALRNVKQQIQELGISESSSEHDVESRACEETEEEAMDPAIKAFLALERKLKGKSTKRLGAS